MAEQRGDLQTPYSDGAAAPSGAGDGVSIRGGRPMPARPGGEGLVNSPFAEATTPVPDTRETPNALSGLPPRVDGYTPGPGDPGEAGGVDLPSLDQDNRGRTLG